MRLSSDVQDAMAKVQPASSAKSGKIGGPDRDRTGDLMNAIHARSQLRYWPTLGRKEPLILTCPDVGTGGGLRRAEARQLAAMAFPSVRSRNRQTRVQESRCSGVFS